MNQSLFRAVAVLVSLAIALPAGALDFQEPVAPRTPERSAAAPALESGLVLPAPVLAPTVRLSPLAALKARVGSAARALQAVPALQRLAAWKGQKTGRISQMQAKAYDGQAAGASGSAAVPAEAAPEPVSALNDGRLPEDVRPVHYDVHIAADPEQAVFHGRVAIDLKVVKETSRIVLHGDQLKIGKAAINDADIPPSAIAYNEKEQTITFDLARKLPAGQPAKLELEYTGQVGTQMHGLYLSTAKLRGKDQKFLFTQFEPADARAMVPSFDEPSFKAVFELTVAAPRGMAVVSNMPAVDRSARGTSQTVSFQKTPPMSTYLLALAIAKLKAISLKRDGIRFGVWTLPGQSRLGRFALNLAPEIIGALGEYFAIPYQLPKLDYVAVPDFAAGAMENWGAITFRDSAILVDEKRASARTLRYAAMVQAHEDAHQWFGDLVTMEWWTDLWLNEAFANLFGYKIIAQLRPHWNLWEDFEKEKRGALAADSQKNTHPVITDAKTIPEIEENFDAITYGKGSSVLRMIEAWIGAEDFREGLRAYMRDHKYGNAKAADLWTALEKASGKPVAETVRAWLTQSGYPIVSVTQTGARTLSLSQRRFAAPGDSTLWPVPLIIRYRLKGETETRVHRVMLKTGQDQVELPGDGELAWAYANGDQAGFYRVSLEGELLSKTLSSAGELSRLERSGILDDLAAMTRYENLPIDRRLAAVESLAQDPGLPVIEQIAGALPQIARDLPADPAERAKFDAWANRLLQPQFQRLGWPAPKGRFTRLTEPLRKLLGWKGEDDDTKLSRQAVLSAMEDLAPSPQFIASARTLADSYLRDPDSVDSTLVAVALRTAAKSNDPALFQAYRQAMAKASDPEQRLQLLDALSGFTDEALAGKFLDMTLSAEIRAQDLFYPYGGLLQQTETQRQAWLYFQRHWTQLREKMGDKDAAHLIRSLRSLVSPAYREEISAFFADPNNKLPEAERTLKQALESIDTSLRYQAAQRPVFSSWLKGR